MEEEIESVLHVAPEVSVYKVPPLKSKEGHRANDWGNLSEPLWKGRLRILETSKGVTIRLEDANSGELFAQATYDPEKPCVGSVLDSSRFFVIRVEDGDKKANIGIGFLERAQSFDFNVALADYTKRWRKAKEPQEETTSPHIPAGPKKDFSLKEGQTFSINIPGKASDGSTKSSKLAAGGRGLVPLLPPPPPASR